MNLPPSHLSRRDWLRQCATGFGSVALSHLLSQDALAGALQPKAPHFPAKAKRVIFLFMHGGPSQVDTFDYKPLLQRDHGKPLPFALPRVVSSKTGTLLRSPWNFSQHGQSGAWVSDLFPHLATCVDDLCFIHSMHCSNSRHGAAVLELCTGSDTFIRPSMGSWISYGLGTESQNLPSFITLCPNPSLGGSNAYGSAFLPADHQGTPVGNVTTPTSRAKIPFIENSEKTPLHLQREELDFLESLNRAHLQNRATDDRLEARIHSFELAFRMQASVPDLQDLSSESPQTQKAYGLDNPVTENFGRQCLLARRLIEQGVRFVQCSHSYKWDQHASLQKDHTRNAAEVDLPIAALLRDLRERGLLEDTLVLWGGEFGRTPVAQGGDGRDHNPHGYTMWMAGGGVRPGFRYGQTDDYGFYATENKVHVHDLHATMLHLLGMDHKRLTYRHAGRNFRLTDVHGHVVHDILA
ncbi:MAG: hypothetical protein RLZZ399_1556 [Verrucomicrobiota bacterium]|jgi:hypothetical protein